MTIVNAIVNEFIVFYDVFIEFTISLFTFPFSSDSSIRFWQRKPVRMFTMVLIRVGASLSCFFLPPPQTQNTTTHNIQPLNSSGPLTLSPKFPRTVPALSFPARFLNEHLSGPTASTAVNGEET